MWSTVLGLALQIIAARVGVVTGKDLATICKEQYSKPVRVLLWLAVELAIVGGDIQQVIGSAIAINILFGLPLWAGALITGVDAITFLMLERLGQRKLEAFFALLILVMAAMFFVVFGMRVPDLGELGLGLLVPSVPHRAVMQAVGTVGAVIMPHNIYLHSALVQGRSVDRSRKTQVAEANYYLSLEAAVSLFASCVINLTVVAVFAESFYFEDPDALCMLDPPLRCDEVGLKAAGDVLANSFGNHGHIARVVWAIGLLAAGQAATMTGTYAGQVVMSGFLDLAIRPWARTLMTRCLAIVPAVIIALLAEQHFDLMDEWLNVLQSMVLPFAVVPLMKVATDPSIMGPYAAGRTVRALGWAIATMVVIINVYLAFHTVDEFVAAWLWFVVTGLVAVGAVYVGCCVYLVFIHLTPQVAAGSDDTSRLGLLVSSDTAWWRQQASVTI